MQKENNNQQNDERSSDKNETKIYLTPDSTLQTPEEDRHDKSIDLRNEKSIEVSNDDLRETNADRFTGSDRAGTAERKENELETDE